MRLTATQLKHVLCGYEIKIPFTTKLRKANLVEALVIYLERSQAKETCAQYVIVRIRDDVPGGV
jgi:hypothetical protein